MECKSKFVKRVFYIILVSALLIFFISIPLTHYNSLRLYLWKQGSSFYDFFTCLKGNIYWERDHLYTDGTIYPPLANLFYAIITRCMSIETLRQLNELTNYNDIKALQECSIYFVIYINILLLGYYLVCTFWKKGSKLERNVFAVLMLFTVPFLYQFERANIIFLTLILAMLFFAWKDSENKILKELSFLSLAIAAGMKLYPAVFGLLLVKEKRYKETIRLILYGILFFLLPFLFYGELPDILIVLLKNLMNTSGTFSMTRIGCQLDYTTVLQNVFTWTGGNRVFWAGVFRIILIAGGMWSIIVLRQEWKCILLLTCIIIGIPSISYVYTAIFIVIPLIVYLDSGNKTYKDLIYLLGMLLVIIPLPFCWMEGSGDVNYSYMNVSTPVWVEGMSILVMTIVLIIEGVAPYFRRKKTIVISLIAIIAVGGGAIGINSDVYNAPYAYTNYLTKTLSSKIKLKDGDELAQSFTSVGTKLEYIVLKMGRSKSGKLLIAVEKEGTGNIVAEKEIELSESLETYNKIELDDCDLEPNVRYVVRLTAGLDEEETISINRTIDYLDIGDEFFYKNGEALDGAMAIQFYETCGGN